MIQNFSFRAIQQGQIQQNHVVNSGAGRYGRALVVSAVEGTRYQIADLNTFTSPKKIQLKRVSQDLLVALPGNDVSSPDIVIKDYFNFDDLAITGLAANGEPMAYDISSLNFGIWTSGINPSNFATNKITAATIAKASSEDGFYGGWSMAALVGGGLLVAAAGGSKSSTSNSSSTSTSAANTSLAKITTYRDATKPEPNETDFSTAGVTGVNTSNILGIRSFIPKTSLPLDTVASVQKLVDSYTKVANEANGTASDATADDPTSSDYRNLMGNNTPSSINDESPGYKAQALALLNDRVKSLGANDVAKYGDEKTGLKFYANNVELIALLVQNAPSTTGIATEGTTAPLLASLGVDITATSLTAVADAIRSSADDLSSLNTTAKLTTLVKAYNLILALANGSTTADPLIKPSAADYAAISADIGKANTDDSALARLNAIMGNLASTAVDTVFEINKLATTLDNIQTLAEATSTGELTQAQLLSAEELRNLGLTGFGGTEGQNKILADKVSAAIRDKDVAAVQAGAGTGSKLVNGIKTPVDQSQLERLQALVSLEIIKNYVVDTVDSTKTTIAPTLVDWKTVGIFKPHLTNAGQLAELESGDVAYLNSAVDVLPSTAVDSSIKLQAMADAYFKIIKEANGASADVDNTSNPTAADYAAIGITGKSSTASAADHVNALELLNDIVSVRSLADVSTVKQIQTQADLVDKIYNLAAQQNVAVTTATQLSVAELQSLGMTGFTSSATSNNTLALRVSQAILDSDPATLLTGQGVKLDNGNKVSYEQTQLERLQALVSLEIIKNYVVDTVDSTKTTIAPTLADWRAVGIFKASSTDPSKFAVLDGSELTYLNSAVNALPATAVDSGNKLQAVADAYFKIIKEANGPTVSDSDTLINPVKADFVTIGAIDSGLNENNANLLTSLVGEKTESQVNQITLIVDILPTIQSVMSLAEKSDSATSLNVDASDVTALSTTKLTSDLSLIGVNDKNHKDVLAAIQNQVTEKVDTFAEIQSLVSNIRIQKYATDVSAANIGSSGEITFYDWASIAGLDGEIVANLSVYNKAVEVRDASQVDALADLQAIVTGYNAFVTDWGQRVEATNITRALDLFHSLDQTVQTAPNATIVGKLIDLAERSNGSATTNTSGKPFSFTGTDLTRTDLQNLGLNVTNIGNGQGTNDVNEMENIWVAIQNSEPSQMTVSYIQGIINNWASQ